MQIIVRQHSSDGSSVESSDESSVETSKDLEDENEGSDGCQNPHESDDEEDEEPGEEEFIVEDEDEDGNVVELDDEPIATTDDEGPVADADLQAVKSRNSNLSKNGVFSATVKAKVDAHAKLYGQSLAHHSNRDFSRAYFPAGITTNAKKTGTRRSWSCFSC